MNKKMLSAMVSILMTLTISYAVKSNASDIEIYTKATGGDVVLTMMLDTSGSMVTSYGVYTCDIPSGSIFLSYGSESSGTTPEYTKNYCNTYTYVYDDVYKVTGYPSNTKWYQCVKEDAESVCLDQLASAPSTTGLLLRAVYNTSSSSTDYYYYKSFYIDYSYKYYDRLTRLKDAIFQLMDSDLLDSDYVSIGIGNFPTQTLSDNLTSQWFELHGKMLVPAKPLDDEQRLAIKTAVANLNGQAGTPTANAYAEAGAYMLGTTTTNTLIPGYSGFEYSVSSSKNGSTYISPLASAKAECTGQGIYFLTDGVPGYTSNNAVMQAALGSKGSSFDALTGADIDPLYNIVGGYYIAEYSRALRVASRNPLGLEIKTAVVGFGDDFDIDRDEDALKDESERVYRTLVDSEGVSREYYDCSKITTSYLQDSCNWGARSHTSLPNVGGYGEGGFYSAQSTEDVIDSIVNFVYEIQPDLEPLATGAPTIPIDSLYPIESRPYGYYAAFDAKPSSTVTLWLGNLNKYDVYNGELGSGTTASNFERLITDDGTLDSSVEGLWSGGVESLLPLGTSSSGKAKRTVFTNRAVDSDGVVSSAESLQQVTLSSLFSGDSEQAYFNLDPLKNYWLNFLGYQVAEDAEIEQASDLPDDETRQVGAVMHSSPILLTQEGKIVTEDGEITTTNRKDYLLFGSTQGVLHVVDDDGEEVLAFVPHEMAESQHDGFLVEGNTTGGKSNLYYGIDAPWTAFTQYVRKSDGTYTVAKSSRIVDDDEVESSGLQWVYGGMRMGGRSYYALDLSDIDDPSLKFHINPDAAASDNALSYMGQSWSKPTLAYVNWGGTKTLVMFVGGGYDAGYEDPEYEQETKQGAGVYMFNANSGELLWWGSANATADMDAETHSYDADLKYSVVSEINALDRDSDGLVDNLYFGDLGGQVFRIDLNNSVVSNSSRVKKNKFVTRITRLYDGHLDDGLSPRFYEVPSFTVHQGTSSLYGVVALSSGNRSSPLAGLSGTNASNTVSAEDGLFVLYDNDVGRSDLYSSSFEATELDGGFQDNNDLLGVEQEEDDVFNVGWKYSYSASNPGEIKGLGELFAIDSILYVNIYERDGDGVGGQCGAAVKGESYVYQFCLPTGKCDFYEGLSQNTPYKVSVGAGIMSAGFGQDYTNSGGSSLIVSRSDSLDCSTNSNSPECQTYTTSAALKQLRWYEFR